MQIGKYTILNFFPNWEGFGFVVLDPQKTDWAYIHKWILRLGFIEILKKSDLKAPKNPFKKEIKDG